MTTFLKLRCLYQVYLIRWSAEAGQRVSESGACLEDAFTMCRARQHFVVSSVLNSICVGVFAGTF